MGGGFLMGLGQGLGNVNKSLSDYLEMSRQKQQDKRQADLDAQNKLMMIAQMANVNANTAHTGATTKEIEDDSKLQDALMARMGGGAQAQGPQIPDIPGQSRPGSTGGMGSPVENDPNDPLLRMAFMRAKMNPNEVLGPLTTTKPPSATIGRAVASLDSTSDLLGEINKLVTAHNPTDPTGKNTGFMHNAQDLGTQFVQGLKYKMGLPVHGGLTPDDERLRQLSALTDVMGAIPYMQGSRNFQMYKEVVQHLPATGATPEATAQKVQTLQSLMPGIREDLLNAGRPISQQLKGEPAKTTSAPAPPMQTQGPVNLSPQLPQSMAAPAPGMKPYPKAAFDAYVRSTGMSEPEAKAALATKGFYVDAR